MAFARAERSPVPGALPRPRTPVGGLVVLAIVGLTGFSLVGVEFNLRELIAGAGPIERFVARMFPPDLSTPTLSATARGALQTFQMSLLGALLGALMAIPLAAVGTADPATVATSRRIRALRSLPCHAARLVLNVFRSIPDILWALVFVVALGLGPFPGTLALTVHSAGVLGKLFSETLETVPHRPVAALRAMGATRLQRLLFARVPQAASACGSLAFYQWECNIRSAAILGFVGAGGIGQEILISINLFDYPRVATLTGATLLLVLAVDRVSATLRRRFVA